MNAKPEKQPVRYGVMLRVPQDRFEEYRHRHAAVWSEVFAMVSRSRIRNFSIFDRDFILNSYFDYSGDEIADEIAKLAADPATQRGWALMEPSEDSFSDSDAGEWCARMEGVFHVG